MELDPNIQEQEAEQSDKKKKKGSFLYDTITVFVMAMVIITVMFTFVIRFVGVDGNSMKPTLHHGDWLIVSAINKDIKQGDIIISTQPNTFNSPLVKRVIATGGQSVDIDFENGIVYVDNVALDEPYIAEKTRTMEGVNFPIVVPQGKLFIMGDNRNDSTDSRSPDVGCVDERYILGVVQYRVAPDFKEF